MASADLKIQNGNLVLPDQVFDGNIYVVDGKIAGIENASYGGAKGKKTIDAEEMTVLPGLIDMHVHMRDPGLTHKEDFLTGTKAAAAGGVTTICDMPNNIPPITTGDRFSQKLEAISRKAIVDYCLYASASGLKDFKTFRERGAIGLKLYMEEAHQKGSPYGSELTVIENDQLWQIFCAAGEEMLPIAVHLDTPAITKSLRKSLSQERETWAHYYHLENSIAREIAFVKLLVMAERSKVDLHISHVPSYGCLERIKEAKGEGKQFTADCIVPAISLDEMIRLGPYAIPLGRPDNENESFWESLRQSVLDCVITDHAPHTIKEKDQGWRDIWSPPPGAPGLETSLGVLLTRVNEGLMGLHELVRISSAEPAKIIKIDEEKGSIEVGKDADLVLVDMREGWKVENKCLYTKCGWSPFDGRKFVGKAKTTILRGTVIMRDEKVLGTPGYGKYITPKMRE